MKPVVFRLPISLFWITFSISFAPLLATPFTTAPAALVPFGAWHLNTQIVVLPASSDPLEAARFYAALPPDAGASDSKEAWIELVTGDGIPEFALVATPGTDHRTLPAIPPGSIGLSAAAMKFLEMGDPIDHVRWRSVADRDVPPGKWLKAEEAALLVRGTIDFDNSKGGSIPDDSMESKLRLLYLENYLAMNEADREEHHGDLKDAKTGFESILSQFERLRTVAGSWNSVLICARIRDVQARLDNLRIEAFEARSSSNKEGKTSNSRSGGL
jgi:hypothetical protein